MIFLLCKLVSKLVIIVTINFWSLKLVTNEAFSCSESSYTNHTTKTSPSLVSRMMLSPSPHTCIKKQQIPKRHQSNGGGLGRDGHKVLCLSEPL